MKILTQTKKFNNKKDIAVRAFTLIETLLYISIFSVVVFMMVSIYGVVMDSRVNARVVSEVTSEGARIMQIITQSARNGTLVNTPTIGNNTTTLSLNVSNNPTMFYMVGNDIVMKEGVGSAIILNSNRTKISGLKFTNLTRGGTKGTVKIEFTISGSSTNVRAPFQFSQPFGSDASLRW